MIQVCFRLFHPQILYTSKPLLWKCSLQRLLFTHHHNRYRRKSTKFYIHPFKRHKGDEKVDPAYSMSHYLFLSFWSPNLFPVCLYILPLLSTLLPPALQIRKDV
ncbi:hypothetical protein V8G54_031684 [Vigna mungo]|uniref:Uncharacterized protein n=1 Tax=Vigna mungo TaxID=3915 RepID=A0AAQ3MJZ4_VIGMU